MDIILALALFLVTSATAYLGVHVTLHPATETSKKWYKVTFGVLTIIAASLIAWQAKLNRREQADLHAQLNKIQKNTETPPQVTVTVPQPAPPQIIFNPSPGGLAHRSGAFMQLTGIQMRNNDIMAGQPISANVFIGNLGTEPAYDTHNYYAIGIGPVGDNPDETDKKVHATLLKSALDEYKKNSSVVHTIGIGEQVWDTLYTNPLTQEQVDGFVAGTQRVYVYAWARWKGREHDLDSCNWIQSPRKTDVADSQLIVHNCY